MLLVIKLGSRKCVGEARTAHHIRVASRLQTFAVEFVEFTSAAPGGRSYIGSHTTGWPNWLRTARKRPNSVSHAASIVLKRPFSDSSMTA